MEHTRAEARPSILIVEPDAPVRTLLEGFFGRVGWACKSWCGDIGVTPWQKQETFDLVIADALSLEWDSWRDLRSRQQSNPDSAFVLLVKPENRDSIVLKSGRALCCIDKDSVPDVMESSLESLVGEFERVKREGRLSMRPRVPVEAQLTIESFTSRELANGVFPFPLLTQLHDAGIFDLNQKLKLQLALQEALANALEHGNLELASEWKEQIDEKGVDRYAQIKLERLADDRFGERVVTIVSDFDCERLLIRITDQGKGFAPPLRDSAPRVSEERVAVFGRGMALIDSAVDEVSYALGGRQISMVKNIMNTKRV